jgi:hypothetical protein
MSNIFVFIIIFKLIHFNFQIFSFFFLNVLLVSRLKIFRLSLLIWLGFCSHCNLACFLWSINFEHSSSNLGLLCFSLWYPRCSLDVKVTKTYHGENCIMMNFITCILHRIFLGWLNLGGWGGWDIKHAWGGERCLQGVDWEAEGKNHWEDLSVSGRIILRWTLGKEVSMRRTGFGRLRIESRSGILWAW